MRLLVTGGRDFGEVPRGIIRGQWDGNRIREKIRRERGLFADTMSGVLLRSTPSIIIHGACRTGADALAADWAKRHRIPELPFPADWRPKPLELLDLSAGPRRNQQMIDDGKPDLVIAFPGGTGTADCVKRARSEGIEVVEIAMPL